MLVPTLPRGNEKTKRSKASYINALRNWSYVTRIVASHYFPAFIIKNGPSGALTTLTSAKPAS